MNRLAPNIPNMIKQPADCCIYCGKSYKKKINLHKHVELCELINKSKNLIIDEDEEEDIPSQKKMYRILLELGNKYSRLEKKVDELNKWVIKKKKTINIIEWLNTNITPQIIFDNLIELVQIDFTDIDYLFEHTFLDTLNHIFSKNIYNTTEGPQSQPIFAPIQKTNTFYIYENEECKWTELSREKLIKFLDKVYMKLHRAYMNFKKENSEKIRDDEKFSLLCDKTSVKMTGIDYRQDAVFGKIKTFMYSRMKTDMKGLVEYEFEF
jgi:hypothetical protein